MSKVFLLLLAVACTAGEVHIGERMEDFADPGDLLVLNATSFARITVDLTRNGGAILVMFYAPWSQKSQDFMPELREAASALKAENANLFLAIYNTDPEENRPLAQSRGVRAFPTFQLIKESGETVTGYAGARKKKQDFISVLKSFQHPAWTEVFSSEDIERAVESAERVVIFGGKQHGRAASSSWKVFQNVTLQLQLQQGFVALAAFKPDVVAQAGIDPPAIQVITNYQGEAVRKHTTPASLNISSQTRVEQFIAKAAIPLAVSTSNLAHQRVMNASKLPVIHVIMADGADTAQVLNSARTVAADFTMQVAFAVTEAGSALGAGILRELGMENDAALPLTVARRDHPRLRPVFFLPAANQLPDVDHLRAFAADVAQRRAQRFIKSEPVPDPPTAEQPVQVVVGQTFEEVVMDNASDVLLLFYAPGCPKSQKLEPEYRRAARKVFELKQKKPHKYGNVVVAKMDISANDVPVNEAQPFGYPSIVFVGAGDSKVQYYTGQLDGMEILKWLKTKAGLRAPKEKDEF